ncbi:hypothetical protein AVEN_59273-1 [Araneus ventricosus]|uniref:Uncharacterized protein n=1 Tax=Araneus ventricosus TaxID=182803 RepID=A0A4Y2G5L4_ARAVE|nr:hypothetical protein AVEN_59273-1 [Araneus ventricosus]
MYLTKSKNQGFKGKVKEWHLLWFKVTLGSRCSKVAFVLLGPYSPNLIDPGLNRESANPRNNFNTGSKPFSSLHQRITCSMAGMEEKCKLRFDWSMNEPRRSFSFRFNR